MPPSKASTAPRTDQLASSAMKNTMKKPRVANPMWDTDE